jgi:thiol:disulfide interchange protein DsbD
MAGGGGYVGAFVVGTVAGVVAAPCTGPIVIMLLGVIAAQGWGVLAGATVMFVYSLGLGMLFLGVGTFAGMLSQLPGSGTWMVTVKHVFGIVLIGATVFYLGQAVDVAWAGEAVPMWASGAITVGWTLTILGAAWILGGEVKMAGEDRSVLRIVAAVLLVGGGLWLQYGPEEHIEGMAWSDQYDATFSAARADGKPIILDFTADWCAACKELEHKTYTDDAVKQCGDEFARVMIDGTTDTPEFVALKEQYGIKGLPAVYFLCPEGDVIPELTLKGFEPAGSFLEKMNVALNTCL